MDDTSRWEIRGLDEFHQVFHCAIGMVHQMHHALHNFREVVGRHVGRHAHRDACGTVQEQVLVKVGPEVHRFFFQISQHFLRHLAQARLGITHGCWVVAVNGSKVSLTVHHGVPQGPRLCHPHHGVVDRAVSVRVVLSEHLSHNPRGLFVWPVGQHPQVEHAVKHPSVHGLKSIAHIGKRPTHNHRHRVVDVGRFHLVRDVDLNDFFSFSHGFQFVPPRSAWHPCFST